MSLFYFCITAWGGNIRVSERDELERCIRHCLKLFDHDISITLNEVLKIACKRKLDCIIKDKSHPLFSFLMFSVRSGRLISTCTTRHLNSFLPSGIIIHVNRVLCTHDYFYAFYLVFNAYVILLSIKLTRCVSLVHCICISMYSFNYVCLFMYSSVQYKYHVMYYSH